MSFPVDVVVMAAGKGTRMKSSKPKVLHRLGGRALAQHVIDTAGGVSARSVVVITGHGAEAVEAGLSAQAGTGCSRRCRCSPTTA
jgi:bifunctional UDP-N-acetylglucosamine pyrophosphorylase/glucosamine-1-phosphate N-acetyltransferase